MTEHDSPDNKRSVTPPRVRKSDKSWWGMLGNDPKLYKAWVQFCKDHNLPFSHK